MVEGKANEAYKGAFHKKLNFLHLSMNDFTHLLSLIQLLLCPHLGLAFYL